jgi:orotate phosphoribosyltransferase
MDENARDNLLSLLARKSFMYSDAPVFKLASGKMSSYYVNCKKTAYDAEGINLIGAVVHESVIKHSPAGVGGLTLGADPIAIAVAGESFRRGSPVKAFVIRKQVKEHGTKSPVEGDLKAGERVVILEDVITTGDSALTAIKSAREFGLDVVAVVALVDRQEGGRERLEAEGLPVESIFTKDELLERYRQLMN